MWQCSVHSMVCNSTSAHCTQETDFSALCSQTGHETCFRHFMVLFNFQGKWIKNMKLAERQWNVQVSMLESGQNSSCMLCPTSWSYKAALWCTTASLNPSAITSCIAKTGRTWLHFCTQWLNIPARTWRPWSNRKQGTLWWGTHSAAAIAKGIQCLEGCLLASNRKRSSSLSKKQCLT